MSSPGDISLEEDDMDAYYGAQAEAYRNWSSSLPIGAIFSGST
jgi:hypothetical protein